MVRIKNLFLILIILFSIISINYNVLAYNQARANSYIIGDNSQITGFPNGGGDIYNLIVFIALVVIIRKIDNKKHISASR